MQTDSTLENKMIIISESFYDELVSPRKNKYTDIIMFSPEIAVTSFKHFKETTVQNVLAFSHIVIDLNFTEISESLVIQISQLYVHEHRNIFSGLKEGSVLTILDAPKMRLHYPPKTRNARVRALALSLLIGGEWDNLTMLEIFLGGDFYKGRKDMVFLSWVSLPKDNWKGELFKPSFIEEPSIKRLLQQYLSPLSPCLTLAANVDDLVWHSPYMLRAGTQIRGGIAIVYPTSNRIEIRLPPKYAPHSPRVFEQLCKEIKQGDIIKRFEKVTAGAVRLEREDEWIYPINYEQPPNEYKLAFPYGINSKTGGLIQEDGIEFENKVLRYKGLRRSGKKRKFCDIDHRNILQYLYFNIKASVAWKDIYRYAFPNGRPHIKPLTEKRNQNYLNTRAEEIRNAIEYVLKSKKKTNQVLSSDAGKYKLDLTKS